MVLTFCRLIQSLRTDTGILLHKKVFENFTREILINLFLMDDGKFYLE